MEKYSGMTINERLFHAGLMDQFDAAIYAKNKEEAISILQQAELPMEAATETVTVILKTQVSMVISKPSNGVYQPYNKLLKFTPGLRPSAGQPTLRFGCPLAKRYTQGETRAS